MIPAEPCTPCDPGKPRGPIGPTEPSTPRIPCGPAGPVAPIAPSSPCDPAGPGSASHSLTPIATPNWLSRTAKIATGTQIRFMSFLLLFQRFFPRVMVSTCRGWSGEGIERPGVVVLSAVRCRVSVSNESTRTSPAAGTVPVPSHDAHHRPFDRAVCFLDRLLSSGSPTALMNAGGRESSTSPSRASLGICGCAAVVLHCVSYSCSDSLTVVAATVKGLTARWGLSLLRAA